MPPALIVTTELDVLKDEGEEYANLLKNAGVNVTYHCYEKLIHGFFDLYNKVARAKKACGEIFDVVYKHMKAAS